MSKVKSEAIVECGWGLEGLRGLVEGVDVVVIVDVLSFSTCVDVATARGARVIPHRWKDETAADRAAELGAELAGKRGEARFSLSPQSYLEVPPGTKILLPSPNGSSLSLTPEGPHVLTGCIRNARAVAEAAMELGDRVAVIPAGEVAKDGSLRAAVEDLIGAGAIIYHMKTLRSPVAQAAMGAFRSSREDLRGAIAESVSGQELIEWGFAEDLVLACQLDVSEAVPVLTDGVYVSDRPERSQPH